ncbi:MAG TPA: alpha/beta fold hydrolase [Acetobacteraceae bacterium]|nr:alpha/beta fold hydrolase [Acetobacteraceae bacterium]
MQDVATNTVVGLRQSAPAPLSTPSSSYHPNKLPPPKLTDPDRALRALLGRFTSGLAPDALFLAGLDWMVHLEQAPFRRLDLIRLGWHQTMRLWSTIDVPHVPAIQPRPDDHRFLHPGWQAQPFNLLQQAFLLTEEWWEQATCGIPGVKHVNERIVSFTARQAVDMFSPSNVPWLNPEVIEATIQSEGRNLIAGFGNYLKDLHERLSGRPADAATNRVGHDVAVTPGQVVFRNELIELIQYAPVGPKVRPEPVLIVPAWIMKYYILDLSPHNSLIRYMVNEGYTVFCISWRNPGPEMAQTGFDDYRQLGFMAALDAVSALTGAPKVHACGYCLGGTLLTVTAAAMARDGDDRLGTMTLFAAETDFTEAGELQLFINEAQLAFLEDMMAAQGCLDARQMAGAFQLLRSNDLIWSRAIKTYLLGERELPNDLMAWNADATRMPYRMHSEYLTHLFMENDLAEGRFPVDGRPVSVSDIRIPFFVVGTETDHVAPWRSVHKLHLLNDGEITFVLTSGGHNAGIVSEPGHPHRRYRIMTRPAEGRYIGPEEWVQTARQREGSWWPAWSEWLDRHSGAPVPPPPLGDAAKGYPALEPAPGHYVLEA